MHTMDRGVCLKIVCVETELVHYKSNLLEINLIFNYYAGITTLPIKRPLATAEAILTVLFYVS